MELTVDGEECCGDQCSSTDDCAAGLFCCPNHNECMDTTTKSTIGPNCDACNPPSAPAVQEKECGEVAVTGDECCGAMHAPAQAKAPPPQLWWLTS